MFPLEWKYWGSNFISILFHAFLQIQIASLNMNVSISKTELTTWYAIQTLFIESQNGPCCGQGCRPLDEDAQSHMLYLHVSLQFLLLSTCACWYSRDSSSGFQMGREKWGVMKGDPALAEESLLLQPGFLHLPYVGNKQAPIRSSIRCMCVELTYRFKREN